MSKLHVLIVNDIPDYGATLKVVLEDTGAFIVTAVVNGNEAFQVAAKHKVDLVISDLKRPDEDVEDFIKTFKMAHPLTPLVIASPLVQELEPRMRQLGVAALFSVTAVMDLDMFPQELLRIIRRSQ